MLDVPWSSGSQAGHAALSLFLQIAETYAFLPREAVTRFLMSCTECQKRMHFNSNGLEPKGKGNGMALAERAASQTRHHQRAVGGCPSWDVSVRNVFPTWAIFSAFLQESLKNCLKLVLSITVHALFSAEGVGRGCSAPLSFQAGDSSSGSTFPRATVQSLGQNLCREVCNQLVTVCGWKRRSLRKLELKFFLQTINLVMKDTEYV